MKLKIDCCYISPCEAAWRLFEFPIQYREHAIERLYVHLPLKNIVIYKQNQNLGSIVHRVDSKKIMLIEWMKTNSLYEDAHLLTYIEFPMQWVWNGKKKCGLYKNRVGV